MTQSSVQWPECAEVTSTTPLVASHLCRYTVKAATPLILSLQNLKRLSNRKKIVWYSCYKWTKQETYFFWTFNKGPYGDWLSFLSLKWSLKELLFCFGFICHSQRLLLTKLLSLCLEMRVGPVLLYLQEVQRMRLNEEWIQIAFL